MDAGAAAASRINQVYATHVIPRPAGGLEKIITTNETVGNKALPEETSPLEIMPATPTEQADSILPMLPLRNRTMLWIWPMILLILTK
nr:hypothetical protein [Desulforamulus aquiferis]